MIVSVFSPANLGSGLIGLVVGLVIQILATPAFPQSDQNDVVHRQQSLPEVRRVIWSIPLQEEAGVCASLEEDLLLLSDSTGVRGWHLSSGHPAWPADENDAGFLLKREDGSVKREFKPSAGTVHRVQNSTRWTSIVPGTFLGTRLTPFQLVSLNLTAQGRLEWNRSAEKLMNEQHWSFESASLVAEENVFVLLRHPQKGWACVALDSSGNRIWSCPVLNLQGTHDTVHLRKVGASLFIVTRQNVTELTIHDSIIRERSFDFVSSDNEGSTLQSLVTESHLVRLCGSQLDVWDRTEGIFSFSELIPEHPTSLWGETQGLLVLSGKSLMAIDINSGKEAWRLAPTSPGLQGAGRGVIMDGSILWSTHDELWQISLTTGEIANRVPLRQLTGIRGGDLTFLRSSLLIHCADRLSLLEISSASSNLNFGVEKPERERPTSHGTRRSTP